jgi:hypothetical protein
MYTRKPRPLSDYEEMQLVRKTLADVHREESVLLERKRMLLELLCLRFGSLQLETVEAIEKMQDPNQLAEWLRRFATAETLEEIGIKYEIAWL